MPHHHYAQDCVTCYWCGEPRRMNTAWIPNPEVVRGAGSWKKAFVT